MADNFLEKQMEDFRSGRLGRPAPRRGGAPAGPLSGSARILAVCPGVEFAEPVLEALSGSGAKVAAAISASREATALTQRFGVRFYPLTSPMEPERLEAIITDLERQWRGVSLIVTGGMLLSHPTIPVIRVDGLPSAALGAALVAMALYALSPHSQPATFTAPSMTLTLTTVATAGNVTPITN